MQSDGKVVDIKAGEVDVHGASMNTAWGLMPVAFRHRSVLVGTPGLAVECTHLEHNSSPFLDRAALPCLCTATQAGQDTGALSLFSEVVARQSGAVHSISVQRGQSAVQSVSVLQSGAPPLSRRGHRRRPLLLVELAARSRRRRRAPGAAALLRLAHQEGGGVDGHALGGVVRPAAWQETGGAGAHVGVVTGHAVPCPTLGMVQWQSIPHAQALGLPSPTNPAVAPLTCRCPPAGLPAQTCCCAG